MGEASVKACLGGHRFSGRDVVKWQHSVLQLSFQYAAINRTVIRTQSSASGLFSAFERRTRGG